MIHVTIFRNSNLDFVGFRSEGHAGYDIEGQDIVCSAVSVLVINTINSIELYSHDDYEKPRYSEHGLVEFWLADKPSHDALLIMKVFANGIKDLSETYSDYICLTFKEV